MTQLIPFYFKSIVCGAAFGERATIIKSGAAKFAKAFSF